MTRIFLSRSTASWRVVHYWRCHRSLATASDSIAVGDRLLLRKKNDFRQVVFTKPLKLGGKSSTHLGNISHDSLIGRKVRDKVTSSSGREFRIHLPSLEEYVTLTPRLVTPVYPADANLIVSLLDIHVSASDSENDYPLLEILEAGTGHGALTLYLARAIHGANLSLPSGPLSDDHTSAAEQLSENLIPLSEIIGVLRESIVQIGEAAVSKSPDDLEPQFKKTERNAVIHSVDISAEHSYHAKKVFRDFRRGIYAGDAEFYVGDVSDWIDKQLADRYPDRLESVGMPFLSHAILDLPASYKHLAKVASALHRDGNLLVFNPSISQIIACVKLVRDEKLPLILDRIVELGNGMTGGREWDIRAVKPRALLKAEKGAKELLTISKDGMELELEEGKAAEQKVGEGVGEYLLRDQEQVKAAQEEDMGWEMICRPKPWARVVGGGFLGVWKKMGYCESASGTKLAE